VWTKRGPAYTPLPSPTPHLPAIESVATQGELTLVTAPLSRLLDTVSICVFLPESSMAAPAKLHGVGGSEKVGGEVGKAEAHGASVAYASCRAWEP
jgi:hypothetical protein